ncbi:MAG: acetate--CoA ligase [Euryarchaeota archaeon]|nr:acetate--CoA ligase [Euryarchaeota archaeon]
MEEGKKFYPTGAYADLRKKALEDPEGFWANEARNIPWFRQWDRTLNWEEPFAKWFEGGLTNASYACLDAHLDSHTRNKVAYYWEDEFGNTRTLSYLQLWAEVNRLASALRMAGVKKGDIVMIYLPMIPELPVSMLALARLGAPHSIVFSGFSSQALADRITDTGAKMLITADFGLRRGKYIPLKVIADQAVRTCPTIRNVVVVRRGPAEQEVDMEEGRDVYYHDLLKNGDAFIEPEKVESAHPLYILYTSGTTGKPKGIVHSTGGYMVFCKSTFKWVFDPRPEWIYWCTADIGWVTGHTYIVYAPLVSGTTSFMFEGSPDYPSIERWWELIERYGINIFYTSPTALRMFMRFGEDPIRKHDLRSLRLLGSVGEPINPEVWEWYFKAIGGERCPIVDTWWQTETGGVLISPAPGCGLVPLKPGSATFPLPGIDVGIVDDQGKPVQDGTRGLLVIRRPWPGMLMTLHQDPKRYTEVYWSRFKGMYLAGDYAIRDGEGYLWLLGRADETLKVAGHRLGTAEIESAAVSMHFVAEAAVVGVPDQVKGEEIVLFAILRQGNNPSPELRKKLSDGIRTLIGPIAVPKEIHFVGKLPKTRSGKIMRRILKALATGTGIGDVSTLEDATSVEEIKRTYEEMKAMMAQK